MEYNTYAGGLTFRDYLSRTYLTVALGLGISAMFAYGFLYLIPYVISFYSIFMMASALLTLGIAFFFSLRLRKMSTVTAWVCYFLYSAITGISLSSLLLYYAGTSVASAFFTTAILFVCMAIIGHTTHIDLSKYGFLFSAGLVTLLIVSLLNAFVFHTSGFWITFFGIILFLGLVAYDMQRLKAFYDAGSYNSQMAEKMMIYGAFQLYLDFINLFIRILNMFGRRRD